MDKADCSLTIKKKPNIGGQALIEGVMMRAPNKFVIAVRKPDGGIVVKRENISIDKKPIFKKPILRGLVGLYDSLVLGIKALNISAQYAMPDEKESTPFKKKVETYLSIIGGLLIGIGLFVYLPLLLTDLSKKIIPAVETSYLLFNFVDGIIRVIFFVLYIFIISRLKDIKRVFAYHGAEHKAIYTYEKDLDLTIENARGMSSLHPRCGTSFLLIVMIVAIFVFSLVPGDSHFLIKFGSRIVFIPLIAGISYEILKLSDKYSKNIIVRLLISPGLWLQRLTTNEPDDSMLEVALVSIKEAITPDDVYVKQEGIEYV